MKSDQLFEAIGEVDPEKILHAEQSSARIGRRVFRSFGVIAAVFAAFAAMTLIVNAATNGAVLNTLRVWLNGEPVNGDNPNVTIMTDANGETVYKLDETLNDYEFIMAKTDEKQEVLSIQRYHTAEDGTFLAYQMQINHVEERDGKIILYYNGDEIDLTEPLSRADKCAVDYTICSTEGFIQSHVLITVQRGPEGQYYVFTEPAK